MRLEYIPGVRQNLYQYGLAITVTQACVKYFFDEQGFRLQILCSGVVIR